jgi:hypothetical protein
VSRTFHSSPFGKSRNTKSRGTEGTVKLYQGVSAGVAGGARIVGGFKTGFLVQTRSGRIKEPTTLLLRSKPVSEWTHLSICQRRTFVKDVRHRTQSCMLVGPCKGH